MEKQKQIDKLDEQITQIKSKINDPKLCSGTALTFTRVSGYYRPVENFCIGKKSEFMQRVEYQLT